MPESSEYRSALKLGQKAFRRCAARGQYPYLPVLDDIVSEERIAQRISLGLGHIPMEHIVGTRAAARTRAFAQNFMPLLPESSEFAIKWERLCKAHLDEGIRDAVKVYEYLNRYYVEEGHKRVSVLRYFDAETVYAQVTRILPEHMEDHPLYEEYVNFYAASRVNYVECSKLGGYSRLQRLLGKEPGTPWSNEDRAEFSAAYYTFRSAFEATVGKRVDSTVGDAMVAYMEVYGYPSIQTLSISELKKAVEQVAEDIALQKEADPIDLKLSPEEKDEGLIAKVLPKKEPKVLQVAFVHDKNPELSGWTYGHELGRAYVQRVFGENIKTTAYFDALDNDPLQIIEGAINEGNSVIFTTSPRLLPASLRAAVEHPKVIILNCSLNMSHRYIRTYYARMYEAKFIAGTIAGVMAGHDDVGYIGDYPIFGQVAGINAFALGVQATNPFAKVYLEWSSVKSAKVAEERLTDRGIWIISSQDLSRLKDKNYAPFGLTILTEAGAINLAVPVWQWGVYYETLLRQILNRTMQTEYVESNRALNYYWGMSAGVVAMRYSHELPLATRKMAGLLEKSIRAGICEPFRGPLYDQSESQVIGEDQSLSAEQIIKMNWLYENVVGSIPAWEDLDDVSRLTVGIVGVMTES